MNYKVLDHIEENTFKSNFLETENWALLKQEEGWKSFFIHFYINDKLIGYTLLLEKKTNIFKLHYIPRGPIIEEEYFKEALDLIISFSKKEGAFLLTIEPSLEYSDTRIKYLEKFKESSVSYQPKETAIINLEEDIIKNIPSKKRGRIRNKHNLIFRETDDLENFYKLYKNTFENNNFKGRSLNYFHNMKKCFKEDMLIFEVLHENTVISSSVNIVHQDSITYLYSGSLKEFNNLYPGYLLVYETAKYAQSIGLKSFDLWGVSYDNPSWKGFSEFKFNMGGRYFKFLGNFDYSFNNLLYFVYKKLK